MKKRKKHVFLFASLMTAVSHGYRHSKATTEAIKIVKRLQQAIENEAMNGCFEASHHESVRIPLIDEVCKLVTSTMIKHGFVAHGTVIKGRRGGGWELVEFWVKWPR